MDFLAFPVLDLSAGTITLSLWAAGAVAGLAILFLVVAIFRAGLGVVVGSIVGIGVVAIALVASATLLNRWDRGEERRALDRRLLELTTGAFAPGSSLACLDAGLTEAVEGSCEKAVFASPEMVAAATAFVGARLTLLIDGLDFANRIDSSYEYALTGLRRAIETDRFGFVAQVLATRDGCTAGKCDTLQWMRDATRIRGNLNDRTFDAVVARNAAVWPSRPRPGTPVAAAPAPTAPATTPTAGVTFPSASSIPPVSIMNNEPAAPAQPAAAAPPPAQPPAAAASPPRRPAAPRTAQPRTQPSPSAPVQLGPSTNAGNPPRTQQP